MATTYAETEVAIVGLGPTGAVLAGLLGRRGIDVTVIERSDAVFPLPRAAHIDHTALRTLQELGCLDELLPSMIDNPGIDFVAADGSVLMQIPSDQRSISGLPASMYFHQPHFDRTVRASVAALPSVRALIEAELTAFRVEEDSVVLDISRDGAQHQIEAAWLIGCDGAASLVREQAGIRLENLQFDEQWLVVDVLLDHRVPDLPSRALAVCDPVRPTTVIPMPGRRFRFEFMLLPGEDPATMQREQVVLGSLLARWIPAGAAMIERAAVYAFHGLLAASWRVGRVLLAGDAAHQMPPFLGQGMNSGIRDAANLAWKLDLVQRRKAPVELLDTYAEERRPHVRSIIEAAVDFGRLVCMLDPTEAELRDRTLKASGLSPRERAGFRLPRLLPGSLIGESGGELFPQQVADGVRFDDVIGQRFAIFHRSDVTIDPTLSTLAEHDGAFVRGLDDIQGNGGIRDWLNAHDADVVVIRPDRYVMYAGRSSEEVPANIQHLLGNGDSTGGTGTMSESTTGNDCVSIARHAGRETWFLDLPPVNAINADLLAALEENLSRIDHDRDIAVVVITSKLSLFSAGADARWMRQILLEHDSTRLLEEFKTLMDRFRAVCVRIHRHDVLFIAAVNGHALAGGLELAVACDLRFAANDDKIQIGAPEMKLFGEMPSGGGGGALLARLLGPGRALAFVLDGEPVTPRHAFEIGLIERLSDPDALLLEAQAFGERVAERAGRVGIAAAKHDFHAAVTLPFDDAMALDSEIHWDAMRRGNFKTSVTTFVERFGGGRND